MALPKELPEQVKKALEMLPEIRHAADPMMRSYLKDDRFTASVNERGALTFVTQKELFFEWLNAEDHKAQLSALINKKVGADVPLSIEYLEPQYSIEDQYADEEDLKQIKIDIIREEN